MLSTPNFVIQEMSLGIHYNIEAGEEDLCTYLVDQTIFDIEDGYIKAPNDSGLGIEINEEVVRRISKITEPWPVKGFTGPDGAIREW
jgi:galactonate dehydratase